MTQISTSTFLVTLNFTPSFSAPFESADTDGTSFRSASSASSRSRIASNVVFVAYRYP